MKIALLFFGITRSLKYTIQSIKTQILDILDKNNVQYHIYIHTYTLNNLYTNIRTGEKNIELDNEEYKLLNPDYLIIDNQEEEIKKLNIKQYYPEKDPWNNNYESFNNYVLGLNSKKKITKLMLQNNKNEKYSHVLFLRPDVKFINNLDIKWFNLINENNIVTPNFHLWRGYNDRFCICSTRVANIYGNIFNYLNEKRTTNSEMNLKYVLKKSKINNILIDFVFLRVRANGIIHKGDLKLINE